MPNCVELVNGFDSLCSIAGKRLFLFAPFLLLIFNACSPSPTASPSIISSSTPAATSSVAPAAAPTDQISFPTLVPTNTPVPVVIQTPSPTPAPEYRNSIVFVSDRAGNKEIFRIDVDGSDFTRLTENFVDDSSPKWSHDKSRISFLSSSGVSNHLYTMDPDGSGMVNLTPGTTRISQCEWSPVAYLIACISAGVELDENGLLIIDATSGEIQTAFTSQYGLLDLAWAPDGEKIALAAADGDGIEVYDLVAGSAEEYDLGEGLVQRVAWSHNGNRLAYSFGPQDSEEFATLYTVKADFSNPRRWIERGGPEWVQSFSPDNEQVLLESSRLGHSEIFIFDLVGEELIQLTNTEESEGNSSSANVYPVYSADGGRIVYASIRGGQSDIFVMDADGTRARNLSDHPAVDTEPDW
jgi:Tol biopolymer transport system component